MTSDSLAHEQVVPKLGRQLKSVYRLLDRLRSAEFTDAERDELLRLVGIRRLVGVSTLTSEVCHGVVRRYAHRQARTRSTAQAVSRSTPETASRS